VSSRDTDIGELVAAVDAKRRRARVRFGNVKKALSWYFERRETMSSPQSMHPMTEPTLGGREAVRVVVDGGGGGDLDGTYADLLTIHGLVEQLRETAPYEHRILHLHYWGRPDDPDTVRRPMRLAGIARELGAAQGSISKILGNAEFFIQMGLRSAGLLPRSRAA